ncbi:MAG: sigma 54-interacting transcriptional regulator, partial [Paracoccaceae bacterium]
GHEPGAFPGAETRREGMLEFADQGTIYLSDIAEVSQALQSRLLRVLETGRFRRLGGATDVATNARIILGTSHDLLETVDQGRFRSELYFRNSAFRIHVPALRDRGNDTVALARHFLQNRDFQRGAEKDLAPATLEMLKSYDWPGNVRELRHAIERGVIVSGASPSVLPEHVFVGATARGRDCGDDDDGVVLRFSGEPTLDEVRASYLQLLLDRHGGNRKTVARILGASERNTYRLISKLPSSRS